VPTPSLFTTSDATLHGSCLFKDDAPLPSLTCLTPPAPLNENSSVQPAIAPGVSDLLDNCGADILALNRADNLRAVIAQVESGEVRRIRERYGPKHGRRGGADKLWPSVNVAITRRERLYKQLEEEFNGDKEKFFHFFSVVDLKGKGAVGVGTGKEPVLERLRPFGRLSKPYPIATRP
jgi:hypothetical protein